MQRVHLAVATVVVLVVAPTVGSAAVFDGGHSGAPAASATVNSHNVSGNPGVDISVPDTSFRPGEQGSLRVVLLNDGNITDGSLENPALEERVTTARAIRVDVGEPVSVEEEPDVTYPSLVVDDGEAETPIQVRTNEQAVARLPDGGSVPVEFRLDVASNAPAGTYDLPVNVSYNYTQEVDPRRSVYNTTSTTRNFTVEVSVEESAQFRVTDVESAARVGATGTVEVTMKNTGSEAARNASVTVTSQNADLTFGQSTSSSRYVGGRWEPSETRTLSYRVSADQSASRQRYAFEATADYEDSDGTQTQSQPVSFGVVPDREQEFSIVSTEDDVAVGDDGPVNVTVRNEGPVDVRDASVTVTSGTGDVVFGESASASQYVGRWATGETREVSVEATAVDGAQVRNYSMEASVAYEDGEGDDGQSGTLQFGLRPAPDAYEFAASGFNSTLRVGEEGRLTGTVTNTGERTADSLVVTFESESETVSTVDREYSVGNLAPGASATVGFDVEISESAAAGPRQFTLRPSYRDGDRRVDGESFDTRQEVAPQRDRFDLDVSNATVERAGTTLLEVTVTNAGEERISDLSAAMFADDPITVDDGEAFESELGAGESTTLTFEISAGSGALAKSYPVEMDFQFDDADGDQLLESGYNVPVEVTEPDSGGGGLPLVPVVLGIVVVLVAAGGYVRYS